MNHIHQILTERCDRFQLTVHRQAVRVLDLGNDGSRTLPTKVGIAQPQRRAFGPTGHHQLSMPSTSSQVMRENTVASKHKRFSLGIERSTNSTSRGAQQVHIDYNFIFSLADLSIYSFIQ